VKTAIWFETEQEAIEHAAMFDFPGSQSQVERDGHYVLYALSAASEAEHKAQMTKLRQQMAETQQQVVDSKFRASQHQADTEALKLRVEQMQENTGLTVEERGEICGDYLKKEVILSEFSVMYPRVLYTLADLLNGKPDPGFKRDFKGMLQSVLKDVQNRR